MATPLESRRIVIAGASSLLGAELKSLLEESRFAASDFRLVDEESVAGLLTEAGGEPAVIQPVEEDSFDKAWIIFFTGSPAFTQRNLEIAKRSGARIVDLSGELAGTAATQKWLAGLPESTSFTSKNDPTEFFVPSASAEIIARLTYGLSAINAANCSAIAFQPVSAFGKAGIEELETQTSQLLSFQPTGRAVFDAQVAFTMLDRFGPASSQKLPQTLDRLRKEIRACLAANLRMPSVQLLHAPVFYGATVTACATIDPAADSTRIAKLCAAVGFTIASDDPAPSNVSSAGETLLQLAPPQPDPAALGTWWFWAAADNLRLPAANAIRLAEGLLA